MSIDASLLGRRGGGLGDARCAREAARFLACARIKLLEPPSCYAAQRSAVAAASYCRKRGRKGRRIDAAARRTRRISGWVLSYPRHRRTPGRSEPRPAVPKATTPRVGARRAA